MKYSEYLKKIAKEPEVLESSSERLYRIITADAEVIGKYPFKKYPQFKKGEHRIHGLNDVLEDFVRGVEVATLVYNKNQTPIILLTGPAGSGKTELGKCIEDLIIEDLEKNPRYVLAFKEKETCAYNEEPLNIITSKLSLTPKKFRKKFYHEGQPQLCPKCLKTYNDLIREKIEHGGFKTFNEFVDFLDELVEVKILPPQVAHGDLTSVHFAFDVKNIMKNCNRGVLHLEVNDCKFTDMPPENYQTLLQLGDGKFVFKDGTSITPDIVILLYTNWDLDEIKAKKPFRDRTYGIYVRRNLSWKEEKDLLNSFNYPFSHINDAALESICKSIIGTRFSNDIYERQYISKWTDIYEMFEEFNPALKDDDLEAVLKRLGKKDKRSEPLDGKEVGISVRAAVREISDIKPSYGTCLRPSDAEEWISSSERITGYAIKEYAQKGIRSKCLSDTVMSFIAIKNKGLENVTKLFEKYYEIFKSHLEGKELVEYNGKTTSTTSAMTLIEEKLCIAPERNEDFKKGIQEFLDQVKPKRKPTFFEIIQMDHNLIISSLEHTEYIPWAKIKKGEPLTPEEERRVKEMKDFMIKELKYCDFCAEDAMKITSEEVLG